MRLVRQLARQLRGSIETDPGAGGTRVSIRFVSHPVPELGQFDGRKSDGRKAVRILGRSLRPSA
jgi:hypothetical protein